MIRCDGCDTKLVLKTPPPAWFLKGKPAPKWAGGNHADGNTRWDLCPDCLLRLAELPGLRERNRLLYDRASQLQRELKDAQRWLGWILLSVGQPVVIDEELVASQAAPLVELVNDPVRKQYTLRAWIAERPRCRNCGSPARMSHSFTGPEGWCATCVEKWQDNPGGAR